ncbi:unnamed protein product [Angiostrongylus costaricensis]|uniref:arginine kinase n=1 Tax=Angiostrongylus costaricensis TaxID=334426 RepID=A0A0R3PJI6_ANGCS|nr:unnamed protein product [Angiostrongylus costaricensis]
MANDRATPLLCIWHAKNLGLYLSAGYSTTDVDMLRSEVPHDVLERAGFLSSKAATDIANRLQVSFERLLPKNASACHSLLKKYLTKGVVDQLKDKKTKLGGTILCVIQRGVANLGSGIGIYTPDTEKYTVFKPLFGSVWVFSPGYPFNLCLSEAIYLEMAAIVKKMFETITDPELQGTHYPFDGVTKEVQNQLIKDHFLFKEGNRFLQVANDYKYWPKGGGIFDNKNKTFLA